MDYSKKSREELIEEIELLKKEEANISNILDNINEMFHSSELNQTYCITCFENDMRDYIKRFINCIE